MGIDNLLFRQLAGSFATGVTVVTSGFEDSFHGMTASSFTSLSLEPPMILVCIDRSARTLPIIQNSRIFNINVLASSQEQLSRTFATRYEPGSDGMRGVSFDLGKLGAPLLEGCLAQFECRVKETYDGGDHVIFAGEVEHGYFDDSALPLLYFRGKYRALEPQIPQPV